MHKIDKLLRFSFKSFFFFFLVYTLLRAATFKRYFGAGILHLHCFFPHPLSLTANFPLAPLAAARKVVYTWSNFKPRPLRRVTLFLAKKRNVSCGCAKTIFFLRLVLSLLERLKRSTTRRRKNKLVDCWDQSCKPELAGGGFGWMAWKWKKRERRKFKAGTAIVDKMYVAEAAAGNQSNQLRRRNWLQSRQTDRSTDRQTAWREPLKRNLVVNSSRSARWDIWHKSVAGFEFEKTYRLLQCCVFRGCYHRRWLVIAIPFFKIFILCSQYIFMYIYLYQNHSCNVTKHSHE